MKIHNFEIAILPELGESKGYVVLFSRRERRKKIKYQANINKFAVGFPNTITQQYYMAPHNISDLQN